MLAYTERFRKAAFGYSKAIKLIGFVMLPNVKFYSRKTFVRFTVAITVIKIELISPKQPNDEINL